MESTASVTANDIETARALFPLVKEALYANPPGRLSREQLDKWIEAHADEVVSTFIDNFRVARRRTMRAYRDGVRSMLDTVTTIEKRRTDPPEYVAWVRRLASVTDEKIDSWDDTTLINSAKNADAIYRHILAREAQFGRERIIPADVVRSEARAAQAVSDLTRPKIAEPVAWARQIGQRIDTFTALVRVNTARSVEAARWIWTELSEAVRGWLLAYGNPHKHADIAAHAKEDAVGSFLSGYASSGDVRPEWAEMPKILRDPFPGDARDTLARLLWETSFGPVRLHTFAHNEEVINGRSYVQAVAVLRELIPAQFNCIYDGIALSIVTPDVFERADWPTLVQRLDALHADLSVGVTTDESGVEDDSALSENTRAQRELVKTVRDHIENRVIYADTQQILTSLKFSDRFIPLGFITSFINSALQHADVDTKFLAFDDAMPGKFALLDEAIHRLKDPIVDTRVLLEGQRVFAFDPRTTPDEIRKALADAYKSATEQSKADADDDTREKKSRDDKLEEAKNRIPTIALLRADNETIARVYVETELYESESVWLHVPPEVMRAKGMAWREVRYGMGISDAAAMVISRVNATTDGIALRNLGQRANIERKYQFVEPAPPIAKNARTGEYRSLKHAFTATSRGGFRPREWAPMPDSYIERIGSTKIKVTTFWWEPFITENMADMADSDKPRTVENPFYNEAAAIEYAKYKRPGYGKYMMDERAADLSEQLRVMFTSMILANADAGWPDKIAAEYNKRWRVHGSIGLTGDAHQLQRWGPLPRAKRLDPHQSSAVAWARQTQGGLIAFDVGVGKTLSALACIVEARQSGAVRRPVIVVPKPIIPQWQRVIADTLPDYRVIVIGLEQETISVEKFLQRKRFKTVNPETDKPWTMEERLARYETRRMKPQQMPQRVEAWRKFVNGEYDLAIVTPVAFGAVSFDDEWVRRYIAETPALQRVVAANGRWSRGARKFIAEVEGRTMADWRAHVAATFYERRMKTRTMTDAQIARSLRAEYPDGVTEAAAPFFTANGIVLNEDDYPVNPTTKQPFTSEEAKAWAKRPTPRDPVVWGVRTAPTGMLPLPIDMIVVDEAHQYKGLITPERRGFANSGAVEFLHGSIRISARAWQLCFCAAATRVLRGGSGGVLLLTATPAKATPLDLYNLLLLGAPDVLHKFGVDDPEVFITRFFGIEPDAVVNAMATLFYTNVANDVNNPLGEFSTLFNSIAVRRTADDVERLRGTFVANGTGQTTNGEQDDEKFGVLTQAGIDFGAILASSRHARLRMLDRSGVVLSVHAIERAQGDTLRVYPPFDGARIDVPWEIRHDARVPLAERPQRVVVEMRPGSFQKDLYDSAQYALLHDAGGSIVPGLYLLALHPALPSFETRGRSVRTTTARLFDVTEESIWISEAEREAILADLSADEDDDDDEDEDDEEEAKKLELDEAIEYDDEENAKDAARYKLALESAFLPHERIVAPATKEGVAQIGGSIDPSSVKFEAVCARIIKTMIDTGNERHGSVNCGHLVFIEPVAANAYLFVLMRRRIEERRSAEIQKIEAEVRERFPTATRAELNAEAQRLIDLRLSRLDPDRIAVMNGPSTNGGDPNELQRLSDGFNGDHEEQPDGSFVFTRRPLFDVLIANKVAYEGVDLQKRTCAVHHVDLPWTPADFIQRNGRSVRQGNANSVVEIFAYIVNHTLDLYRLRRVEGRRQWLSAMLSGSSESQPLGGSDDDSRVADALGALPAQFAREREENLRRLLAELKENKKARVKEKTFGYLSDLVRAAEEAFAGGKEKRQSMTINYDVLFATATGKDATAIANRKVYLAGLYGSIQALRAKNGGDVFPWVEMVVQRALAGDTVFIARNGEGASATYTAAYPGMLSRDARGKASLFTAREVTSTDVVYYTATEPRWTTDGWDISRRWSIPNETDGAMPYKTGDIDWTTVRFEASTLASKSFPPFAFPSDWMDLPGNMTTLLAARTRPFGSIEGNIPFFADVPLLTDKGTLLLSGDNDYLRWVAGKGKHPEVQRIADSANTAYANAMRQYNERVHRRSLRIMRAEADAKAYNDKEAERFAADQAEYEKDAARFAEAMQAYTVEQARYTATVNALTVALPDEKARAAAIAAIEKPSAKLPTAPKLPKPAKVKMVKMPKEIDPPVRAEPPSEPPRPTAIPPTPAGFKQFIDAARRTPSLDLFTFESVIKSWFGRKVPRGVLAGSLVEVGYNAYLAAYEAHRNLPFDERMKAPVPEKTYLSATSAKKYGFDAAKMAELEAALASTTVADYEAEEAAEPIELDVIE